MNGKALYHMKEQTASNPETIHSTNTSQNAHQYGNAPNTRVIKSIGLGYLCSHYKIKKTQDYQWIYT